MIVDRFHSVVTVTKDDVIRALFRSDISFYDDFRFPECYQIRMGVDGITDEPEDPDDEAKHMDLCYDLVEDFGLGGMGGYWFWRHFGTPIWRLTRYMPEYNDIVRDCLISCINNVLFTAFYLCLEVGLESVKEDHPDMRPQVDWALFLLQHRVYGPAAKYFVGNESLNNHKREDKEIAGKGLMTAFTELMALTEQNEVENTTIGYWLHHDEEGDPDPSSLNMRFNFISLVNGNFNKFRVNRRGQIRV